MGAIGSLASVVKMAFGSDPVQASMVPLDENGNPFTGEQKTGGSGLDVIQNAVASTSASKYEKYFQYFPETITSNRSVNWASKPIPGGSHPLYQFIGGTDHTIAFTAIFTSDENTMGQSLYDSLAGGVSIASLAKKVFGAKKKHNVDVAAAIAWLRSFTYASYAASASKVIAPPVLRLYLPNSGIWGAGKFRDSVDVVMTQCDVTYESFHRTGHPRIAVVNLSFFETIQVGKNWKFVDRNDWDKQTAWLDNYDRKGNSSKPSLTSNLAMANMNFPSIA
jgi:hypothetical protein